MSEQEYIQSGAIEACVLGVATPEELAELDLMKAQYPAVMQAVQAFEQQLELQAMAAAVPPPPGVKNAVMQQIQGTAVQAPVVNLQPASGAAPVKPLWWRYAAAACVAIMLGSIAFNFMLAKKVKNLQQEVLLAKNEIKNQPNDNNAQFAFMRNPEITPVAMYGVNLHKVCKCTLFWDQKEKKAYLVVHHLVQPGQGKEYQLWAMINGKPVSAGMLGNFDLSKPIPLDNIPDGAAGFAVTLEKAGGSPTPTLEEMYLNGKIS